MDIINTNPGQQSPANANPDKAEEKTTSLAYTPPRFAAIFDMDGTLVNNTPYHFKSWQMLFKKYGKGELTEKQYYTNISGVPVKETIQKVFGNDHDQAGLNALFEEKEKFYRHSYAPFVTPVAGLVFFLSSLKKAHIKMAMASSATVADINFILGHIPVRQDFDAIVDSTMSPRPKPNPDIFLKAAQMIGVKPENCIVFEDSLAGIKAGNAAGMKVVGITTGHKADELHPVNLVINDFSDLTVQKLAALFDN